MKSLSVLIKPASSMCNMKCDYCFYCDEAAKRNQASYGFMSEDTLKNIIRRTMPHAELSISYAFQGGEPTLAGLDFFKKVVQYQKQYNKKGIPVQNCLQTNGFAITEEWCEFLHDNHFLVGISCDGTPAIHNLYRHDHSGNCTFTKIHHAIHLMEKYHINYNILTVVTKDVAENICGIYTYYRKNNWMYQQYIACLDPLGEEHGKSSYALTPSIYGNFLITLFKIWAKDFSINRQPYIRQFDNYLCIASGYAPEACDQTGTCSIQYVVEANGNVYPCDFYMLDQFCLGNFNENRIQAIDQKRDDSGFLLVSKQITHTCQTCCYHWICRGGCQRSRDLLTDENAYHNYFCESYRMFFDACLDQIINLAQNR